MDLLRMMGVDIYSTRASRHVQPVALLRSALYAAVRTALLLRLRFDQHRDGTAPH